MIKLEKHSESAGLNPEADLNHHQNPFTPLWTKLNIPWKFQPHPPVTFCVLLLKNKQIKAGWSLAFVAKVVIVLWLFISFKQGAPVWCYIYIWQTNSVLVTSCHSSFSNGCCIKLTLPSEKQRNLHDFSFLAVGQSRVFMGRLLSE